MEGASSQPVLPLDNDLGRLESEEKDQLWTQFEEWKRTWLRTQWPLSNQPQGQERTGWSRVGEERPVYKSSLLLKHIKERLLRPSPLPSYVASSCCWERRQLSGESAETQISSNVNGQNWERWSPKAGSWAAALVQREEGGGEAWISGVFPAHLSKTPS